VVSGDRGCHHLGFPFNEAAPGWRSFFSSCIRSHTMSSKRAHDTGMHELDTEERAHITRVFAERVGPRLRLYSARMGSLGCGFAGEAYDHWVLHFRSVGDDFEITEFEYDEDARTVDLGL